MDILQSDSGFRGFDQQLDRLREELAWRVGCVPAGELISLAWFNDFVSVVIDKLKLGNLVGITPLEPFNTLPIVGRIRVAGILANQRPPALPPKEQLMNERTAIKTVAAFDFDGTITTKDTFMPFLERAFGKTQVRLAMLSLIWEAIKVGLRLSTRDKFKELIVGKLFLNETTERLRIIGHEHAKAIATWYRPGALERIRWHREQGHRLVMVSASLDLYLEPAAKALGFDDLLCTRLSTNHLVFDGRLNGANCRRAEKVRLLESLLGPLRDYEVYAYGDSAGDTVMLYALHHPFYRPFVAFKA